MKKSYPKDTSEKKKERKSFQILMKCFDTYYWDFQGSDNSDHGVDYTFELIENEEYKGYRVFSQIKGKTDLEVNGDTIVFDFPVNTANYAVSCAQPFLLFYVDLKNEEAYYLPLQDYFISNPDKLDALEKNKTTVRVFIPIDNKVGNKDMNLVAKSQYTFNDDKGLRKTR